MSFLGINIAGSALETFQEAENVTSQNIANVQTPGASRQIVNIGQLPPIDGAVFNPSHLNPGTQGTGVLVASILRVHQDSYDALFRGATSSQNFYSTQQSVLTALQSAMGEPSNGINAAFTAFQTAVQTLANNPQGIAVDATSVYWTTYAPSTGTVMKVDVNGGVPRTLASEQGGPQGIVVDRTNVYWLDVSNGVDGTVMRMDLDGGNVTTLARSPVPGSIAIDDTSLYWTDLGPGSVRKIPVGGGAVTTLALASPTSGPGGIVVDATSVYWTDSRAPNRLRPL